MKLATRLALSFLRRRRSRMPAFTAVVSVLGVSFGVAAFLVVVTIFSSFEKELRSILFAANPNLIVFKFPKGIPSALDFQKDLAEMIPKPVRGMSRFEYSEALLSKGGRSALAVVRAVEGQKSANAPELDKIIRPAGALATLDNDASPNSIERFGSTALPAVVLGKGLALKIGAEVGDVVTLTAGGYAGGKNVFQELRVTGFMSIGLGQYDERLALLNFLDGVALFGNDGAAKGIEVAFQDPDDALPVARLLDEKLPYSARAWQDIDRNLFEQIERDGTAIQLIVLVITFVAAFNIIVTLSLSVADRQRQIALLRSLGASSRFIVAVFSIMGAILGGAGALLGVILATVLLKVFAGLELGELQAFYFLERIPVAFRPELFFWACLLAIVLSLVSALLPAYKATQVSPLTGLRP